MQNNPPATPENLIQRKSPEGRPLPPGKNSILASNRSGTALIKTRPSKLLGCYPCDRPTRLLGRLGADGAGDRRCKPTTSRRRRRHQNRLNGPKRSVIRHLEKSGISPSRRSGRHFRLSAAMIAIGKVLGYALTDRCSNGKTSRQWRVCSSPREKGWLEWSSGRR
jgi:hypothetical protein